MGTGHSKKEGGKKRTKSNPEKGLGGTIHVALFGLQGAGKSTIARQLGMKQITLEERAVYRSSIMKMVVRATLEMVNGWEMQLSDLNDHIQIMQMYDIDSIAISTALHTIWSSPNFQSIIKSRTQFPDAVRYYLSNIDRIASDNYIPNDTDILRCPVTQNSGILEVEYKSVGATIRVVEVAGQGDLRKWIPCFEDFPAIIFSVALNEYDLANEDGLNKMIAALRLFEDVCSKPWFKESATILLLNKEDLFLEKLQRVNLTKAFPEYKGGNNPQSAIAYIKSQFQQKHPPKKALYSHVMSAIDPASSVPKFMHHTVKDIVLRKAIAISTII